MSIKEKWLPDGCKWTVSGLMKSLRKMANACPAVYEKKEVEDDVGSTKQYALIGYCIEGQEETTKGTWISYDEIQNGKFFEKLPMEVIIEPGCRNKAKELFLYCIKKQLVELPVREEKKYRFGWNGKEFCMGDPIAPCKVASKGEEYEAAGGLLSILANHLNSVICALLLAKVHGPLMRVLEAAGIIHNFVTFIVGETGIGKTKLAQIMCKIHGALEQIFSIGSERKELKRILGSKNDVTIVLDDYCITGSSRVSGKQKQTMSEVIQAASDAGRDVTDASEVEHEKGCIHLVVTGEEVIKNISTMNRLFLVQMDELLPQKVYDSLTEYADKMMPTFMNGLFFKIGNEWDEIVSKVRTDYRVFFEKAKNECSEMGSSANRIASTMAVQQTIWKIIVDYFRMLELDGETIDKADQNMQMAIRTCTRDLGEEIRKIKGEKDYKRYLPVMVEVFQSLEDEYSIADKESTYKKHRDKPYKGLTCIGAYLEYGYWSVIPEDLCKILTEKMREEVTPQKVSAELQHYRLAHVDSESKLSSRWRTKTRMYHIDIRALFETMGMGEEDIQRVYPWNKYPYRMIGYYSYMRGEDTNDTDEKYYGTEVCDADEDEHDNY